MNFLREFKDFIQRIGLVGITNILVTLSSLILLPILTKSFSVSDYGIWVIINTTITLIPIIATLGLPYTMVRFLSAEKDKGKIQEGFYSIATIVLASTIITSLMIILFSKDIGFALFKGNANLAILLSMIILFACLNSILLNYFRTFLEMKKFSIFSLIQVYLGVLIVSYFAIEGYGIFIAVFGLLIANLLIFIIMTIFIISEIGFKIPRLKNLREYLGFGLPTIPSNISYWIVDSSDRYIIGILLGSTFVGYYAPGYAIGSIIIMIQAPFSLLLPSVLPKYYEENKIEELNTFLKYSLKYFLLLAIPAAFGLSLLSKPILMILTTPEIAQNSYLITPFVALCALLFGIYGIIGNIILLEKKTKILAIIWIIAAFLNIILNIIFIPHFGIIGAATVTLIAYILAFGLTLNYSSKFLKSNFDLPFILKSILASIIMSLVIILMNPEGIINVLVVILISLVVYMVLILLMKGIEKNEIKYFKMMIRYN